MPFIMYSDGTFHASHKIICMGGTSGCGRMIKAEVDSSGTEADARAAWMEATKSAAELADRLGWGGGFCPLHRKAPAG